MKKLFGVLFLVAMMFCAGAEAGVKKVKTVVSVVKSDTQPEVTAIARGTFPQFTSFDLDVFAGKGKFSLDGVKVEIFSGEGNDFTLGQVFQFVQIIANTSPGNNEAVERTIVASILVDGSTGSTIDINVGAFFEDNARFTIVGILREEGFQYWNGRTVGLAVTTVSISQKGSKIKVVGKLPITGTLQIIDTNAYAGSVYITKTTVYDGGIYPAIIVWATTDVIVKKVAFRKYFGNNDAKVSVSYYNGIKEYDSVVDRWNGVTSCNFYTKERELGMESCSEGDGLFVYAGQTVVFYSKNSANLFGEFDPNGLVVVSASMPYRLAPVIEDEGKACFLAGTLVKMADGSSKPIENVKVGDKVWTGEGKYDLVTKIIKKHDLEWLSVVIGDSFVRTVPDQGFFVIAQERDGTPPNRNEILYTALMLKVGDIVRDYTGKLVEVRAKSPIYKEKVPTWDLVLRSGVFYYADGFKVHSVVE